MPDEPVRLPLRVAFLEFGVPGLAAHYREVMQEVVPLPPIGPPFSVDELWRHEGSGTPLPEHSHLVALFEAQTARYRAAVQRREEAWQALEPGFRNLVALGEVVLEGLQCVPTLATARSTIPSLWARLLIFDAASNRITTTVQDSEFIDVVAYRATRPISAVTNDPMQTSAMPEVGRSAPPRPRGRESYEPLIEAALRANWDEVQGRAEKRQEQRPIWSELARSLHKQLVKEHRGSKGQIPHEQTIRTRLPQIYARLLSENPVRK